MNNTNSPSRERADCTVIAMAAISGRSYLEAHDALAQAGRKNGRRFSLRKAVLIGRTLGVDLRFVCGSGTVAKLIRNNPAGRLLIRVRGHAFTIHEGIASDATSLNTRVKQAWIVQPKIINAIQVTA